MENKRLYEATIKADVWSLLNLIQEDALTLYRNNTTKFLESPLHVAVLLGHEQFALELLQLKPDLSYEVDVNGSSPLHLASANGQMLIVKRCLEISHDTSFGRNRDGKNPVHIAAMRGRVDILREFMCVIPDAGRAILEQDNQTILHLCVEYGQLEALKFLVENGGFEGMVNRKNASGNTILHVAVANKQVQITDFLLGIIAIDINALNNNEMTPMDILIQRGRDIRDMEIEGSLIRARASCSKEYSCRNEAALYSGVLESKYIKEKGKDNWVETQRNTLMVVASLIATMAFQVGVSPPPDGSNTPQQVSKWVHTYYGIRFFWFYVINTTGFFASLSIILILMSGLPLKNKFIIWILMVITWIAISATALSYAISVIILTRPENEGSIISILAVGICVWICLMALLLTSHTIRVIHWVLRVLINVPWKWIVIWRKPQTNTDSV